MKLFSFADILLYLSSQKSSKDIYHNLFTMKTHLKIYEVVPIQDNDGHWYVIPASMRKEFDHLLDTDENKFIDTFEKYMTGGGLSNFKFYTIEK